MRKRIIDPIQRNTAADVQEWLDLDRLAEVEVTSEDAAYPIESALLPGRNSGWRAGRPGEQTIRLLFAHPQRIRRIALSFVESGCDRTQEYVLRWSPDGGKTFRDIVRQQWNFSQHGATSEIEDHRVDLQAVTALELRIIPDKSGGNALASLGHMRIA